MGTKEPTRDRAPRCRSGSTRPEGKEQYVACTAAARPGSKNSRRVSPLRPARESHGHSGPIIPAPRGFSAGALHACKKLRLVF